MTPDWWNRLHDLASAELTDDWQSLGTLRHRLVRWDALDDLVVANVAERKYEPTHDRNGRENGATTSYRRGIQWVAPTETEVPF